MCIKQIPGQCRRPIGLSLLDNRLLHDSCFVAVLVVVQITQTVTVTGGGLTGTFKAAQLHFHWGSDSTKGSEHTLNGNQYPMEASDRPGSHQSRILYRKIILLQFWIKIAHFIKSSNLDGKQQKTIIVSVYFFSSTLWRTIRSTRTWLQPCRTLMVWQFLVSSSRLVALPLLRAACASGSCPRP